MVMRRCPTNRFEDGPYNISRRRGEGGHSLYSSSYSYPLFVVVLVIIVVVNFIIEDLGNRHVKIGSNSFNAALHVLIGVVDAYLYRLSGLAPGQS